MNELIYYVDKNDAPTGETCEKYAAHNTSTKLHAAFSVYIFNDQGKFLVTRRATTKKVWPGVWTNSCCGHPFPGESREDALARRVEYELGMKVVGVALVLPKYTYKTPPYNGIVEHEYCPVYIAKAVGEPIPNQDEVAETYWLDWDDFVLAAEADDAEDSGSRPWMKGLPAGESRSLGVWSWWCKDQLIQLKKHPLVAAVTKR